MTSNVSTSPSDATVETGTVATNGVQTYYERRGSGPAIVFVHAFVLDHRQWAQQADALADDYTVVTYDMRGHGQTGGSAEPRYTADLLAADLDALCTELELDRPLVCGLSMGGMVAQAYAANYPEKLSGLVLADTFTPGALRQSARLALPHLALFARLSPMVSYKRLNAFQLRVGKLFAPKMVGDAQAVQRLVDTGATMSSAEFRKAIRSILDFIDSEFDAARITVPTRVLYGEHEPNPLRAMAAHLAATIGHDDVELDVIPDAGHASNLDNPEAFTAAIRALGERVV